ncbi:MAG: hypothetical protein PGN07_04675 [Aeromicrobium erythreum]
MKITAEPRSDQINADDFVGSPATFTIANVRPGSAEQKYDIDLAEVQGRCWRPPLTMLRLLIAAWGDDAEAWKGRRVTLYRDDSVRFGSDAVSGIRVSHMSHLPTGDKPFSVKLTASRGRRAPVTVQPLKDSPAPQQSPEPTAEQIAAETDADTLRAWWKQFPNLRPEIEARFEQLNSAQAEAGGE